MQSKSVLVAMAISLAGLAPASAAGQAVAESKLAQSSVSIMVEPTLNDGRLVIKLAAKNLGPAPVNFGPSTIAISKPSGAPIAIYSLSSLIADVRAAAGMAEEASDANAATQSGYGAPQQTTREGRMDVSTFTGGQTIGRDEYMRRSKVRKMKPTITEAEAAQQIAALNQAILVDRPLPPGQLVAGQIVTEMLKFAKGEDRTLFVRVRVGADEHPYTIAAPKS